MERSTLCACIYARPGVYTRERESVKMILMIFKWTLNSFFFLPSSRRGTLLKSFLCGRELEVNEFSPQFTRSCSFRNEVTLMPRFLTVCIINCDVVCYIIDAKVFVYDALEVSMQIAKY